MVALNDKKEEHKHTHTRAGQSVSYLRLRSRPKPDDGVGGPGGHGHLCPVNCEPQHTCAVRTHTPATHTCTPCLGAEEKKRFQLSQLLINSVLTFVNGIM